MQGCRKSDPLSEDLDPARPLFADQDLFCTHGIQDFFHAGVSDLDAPLGELFLKTFSSGVFAVVSPRFYDRKNFFADAMGMVRSSGQNDLFFLIRFRIFQAIQGSEQGIIFCCIVELAHIAGPGAGHKAEPDIFGKVISRDPAHGGEERQDILFPLPERRKFYRNDIQTVIKIFTEFFLPDQFLQIGIGCGEYADINIDDIFAAKTDDLLLLENTEKLDLKRIGNIQFPLVKDMTPHYQSTFPINR